MGRMLKKHKDYLSTVGKYFHLFLYQFVLDKMDSVEFEKLKSDNGLLEVNKEGKVMYEVNYKTLFQRANTERIQYNKSRLS